MSSTASTGTTWRWRPTASIPGAVTFHSLRRSYATLMAEAGASPAYTMRQIGHSKAAFALELYTDVKVRRDAGPDRIGALLRACEMAHSGANRDSGAPADSRAPQRRIAEDPAAKRFLKDGEGQNRTVDNTIFRDDGNGASGTEKSLRFRIFRRWSTSAGMPVDTHG
jgi:Phage integrase family